MTKELFVETIEALRMQYEHDEKCSKAFQIILPQDHISSYDHHWVSNQLVKLLQITMNDEHEYSWIEYYLFELDFGKKYKDGCASYKDGELIDISTPEKLYDFLKVFNMKEENIIKGNESIAKFLDGKEFPKDCIKVLDFHKK